MNDFSSSRRVIGHCGGALVALAVACTGHGPGGSGAVSATGHGGGATTSVIASSASGAGGATVLPPSFTVTGKVIDQDGKAVAGAIVLQGGHSAETTFASAADGSFSLTMTNNGLGTPTAVATKLGYRTAGLEIVDVPQGPIELQLYAVNPPDNQGYAYGEPGKGADPSTAQCGHCHESIAKQFQTSKHAQATKDPLVQDLYAGVTEAYATKAGCEAAGGLWRSGLTPGTAADATIKCYLGGGVLPDLNPSCGGASKPACDDPALAAADKPNAFGACADCHSPGMAGKAGGRNLHDAVMVAYDNGVHCDFCHKVADIDISKPPGAGQRLRVQRPSEKSEGGGKYRQVFFGPLLDVPNPFMGGSYQPKFTTAAFCAGCHQQEQQALVPGATLAPRFSAGLPVHSTFAEWMAGPYAAAGVPCQHCHMPANHAIDTNDDHGNPGNASITFGFPRPAEQIRQHIFRSPLVAVSPQGPRLIDTALSTVVDAQVKGTNLEVGVTLGNTGCGHAIPTGEPMRGLVLLVSASCQGETLIATGGLTVNDVGGARARGVIGNDATAAGSTLTWLGGAKVAKAGDVVRIVRPNGTFDDYDGIGLFGGNQIAAKDKGLPIVEPIARAAVLAVNGNALQLDAAFSALPGDVVYLGDPAAVTDGKPSRAVAGEAGYTFARVVLDAKGARQVPHYRGIDLASDNRIAPGKTQKTSHRFAIPQACKNAKATVSIAVLYRPVPIAMAELRGWTATDYLIAQGSKEVAVP